MTLDAGTVALLADLADRGITLEAHGDRLRFHPRSAMTLGLTTRIKGHKGELMAFLAGDVWLPGAPECPELEAPGDRWPVVPEGTAPRIVDLVTPRAGWTPGSWRGRLVDLAVACGSLNPTRAAELREALGLLDGDSLRQT